jgi:hypothetical protein
MCFAILRDQGEHRFIWVEEARPSDLDGHWLHLGLVELEITGPEGFPTEAVFTSEITNNE